MRRRTDSSDPISEIQRRLQADDFSLAAACGISRRYLNILKTLGPQSLPRPLLAIVGNVLGPAEAVKLEGDYRDARAKLSADALAEIQRKNFPAGEWAGSPTAE